MEGKVRKIVQGFLEALGRPLEPWAAEYLEKWKWRGDWYTDTGEERMRVTVELRRDRWDFRLPVPPGIPHFTIEKWGEGAVKVNTLYLEARDERAFFMTRGESGALSETLALVRGLSPLFQALGLGDLEEALLALGDLKTGAKTNGAYVLISDAEREVLALRRGSLLGDPGLDKAFLLGEEVVLPYPEGEVALLGGVSATNSLVVSGFRVRWRDEVFPRDGGLLPVKVRWHVLNIDPIPCLLRQAARAALEEEPPPPPALRELLRGMTRSEDPIRSLRDESFLRELKLRLLSRL